MNNRTGGDGEISFKNLGRYAFYNQNTGCYLACQGKEVILSKSSFGWIFRRVGENRFNIHPGESDFMLDIDNAYIAEGTKIKVQYYTGYDVQIWSMSRNENGTYSIVYSGNSGYCLGFICGRPVLQLRNRFNKMQEWKAIDLSSKYPARHLSFESKSGTVQLLLSPDVLKIISEPRLKQWANDLETAYDSFCELTNFRPYRNVIVEAYKPTEVKGSAGWVIRGSNIIHIDRDFIYGDLEKMSVRKNDWNFCVLHEMGHMFDFDKPWNFEEELLTDLKIGYVLEKNNAAAAPAEFGAFTLFRGADIIHAYKKLSGDFSKVYDIFGCTERFLKIKQQIGWEPFKQTFHYLQENSSVYARCLKYERFLIFVNYLSYYSNKEIKGYFSPQEWNTVLKKCT